MSSYVETMITQQVDGSALTAAAAASMLPAQAKFTFPANFFQFIGQSIRITASGRISNVITTPGTGRFDVRFGGTVVFDSLAFPLNQVAKTNVGWWLEIVMTVRAMGSAGNFMGLGNWTSEAYVGSPAASAGGNGTVMLPYNVAPAVGNNVDFTAAQQCDMFFTQTVATGSMTCHEMILERLN